MTINLQRLAGSSRTAVLAAAILWLIVQNSLLLASEPGQLLAAPLVVARALFGVAGHIVSRYPGLALLLTLFLALVIFLGIAALKDSGTVGSED